MTEYGTTGSGGTGERWNVNLPAVIAVVFVFLVAVIVWVIATSGGDDSATEPDPTGPSASLPDPSVPLTTTAPPMPETTTSTMAPTDPETGSTTTTTSTVPPTTSSAPVTTAPGAEDGAVPGDLGSPGRPMQRPPCEGEYIAIFASAVGDQATADGIAGVLDAFPGTEYLRTDQTCSSLRPDVDGEPIYVVYRGPFAFAEDACTARAEGPDGAYVKQLSNDVPVDQVVACD